MNIATAVLPADTWMQGGVGTGWWIGMMAGMVLFWGAIILGIVWLARGPFDGRRGGRRETPVEILEGRLAEGAISVAEYHERREVLGAGAHRRPEAGGEDGRAAPRDEREGGQGGRSLIERSDRKGGRNDSQHGSA